MGLFPDCELEKIDRAGMLPAGVVYTGGGAKLNGLTELSKQLLRLPASIGYPIDIPSVTQHSNDLAFTGAIGLVKWGSQVQNPKRTKGPKTTDAVGKMWKQVRKAGKWLIP